MSNCPHAIKSNQTTHGTEGFTIYLYSHNVYQLEKTNLFFSLNLLLMVTARSRNNWHWLKYGDREVVCLYK